MNTIHNIGNTLSNARLNGTVTACCQLPLLLPIAMATSWNADQVFQHDTTFRTVDGRVFYNVTVYTYIDGNLDNTYQVPVCSKKPFRTDSQHRLSKKKEKEKRACRHSHFAQL